MRPIFHEQDTTVIIQPEKPEPHTTVLSDTHTYIHTQTQ